MKVIGLMPVKNESWILPTTLPSLLSFVDELLVLDTGSTDGSQEILAKFGVAFKRGRYDLNHQNNYAKWRNILLSWGREKGGTHFVWLDADEAFTTPFLQNFPSYLRQLKPGQKLFLDWLCLWKSPFHVRSDNSVWKKIIKDFVVYDDEVSFFSEKQIRHEGRTQGPSANPLIVPREAGAVFHFQFVPFLRFQMKQAFQRVRELWENVEKEGCSYNRAVLSINRNYAITLDDPKAKTSPIPKEWYEGLLGLSDLSKAPPGWYEEAIFDFFKKKPIAWFEPLQIWHIPSLRKRFVEEMQREPVSRNIPPLLKMKSYLRNHWISPIMQFVKEKL